MAFLFPITLAEGEPFQWKLTPGYKRTFATTKTITRSKNFSTDFENLFQGFGDQSYLYRTFPVIDIFSKKTVERFKTDTRSLKYAKFDPKIFLSYSRRYGSHIYDLFVPCEITPELGKKLVRNADSLLNHYTHSVSTKTSALNLFGKLGAYPIFSFYKTEEITTTLKFSMETSDSWKRKYSNFNLQNYLTFIGNNNNKLSFENSYSVNYNRKKTRLEEGSLSFLWHTFPENNFKLPFFKDKSQERTHFQHNEILRWSIEKEFGNRVFSIFIKHETRLVFPEIGFASIHLAFGISKDRHPVSGIEGGIEMEITF